MQNDWDCTPHEDDPLLKRWADILEGNIADVLALSEGSEFTITAEWQRDLSVIYKKKCKLNN